MKKLLIIAWALLMVFGVTGFAGATPWSDTVGDNHFIGWWDSYSYQHDITGDGFTPLSDVVTDYVLTIDLDDDGGFLDSFEVAIVSLPGVVSDGSYSFDYANNEFGVSLAGLIQINLLGTLDVTISSIWGDFWFDSSTLVANGYDGVAPVPEPATMLLLGAGLVGLAGYGRKKFFKKDHRG